MPGVITVDDFSFGQCRDSLRRGAAGKL